MVRFSLVDVLPLVAAETGLVLPAGVEGLAVGERDVLIAESFRDAHAIELFGPRFDRDLFAVVRWPWKLILSDREAPEVYELDDDAAELANRAGRVQDVESDLRARGSKIRAAFRPPARPSAPADVSSEMRLQLKALRYID
jgi:hypothetical protein